MPIINRQDASDVEARIKRIFEADSREARASEIRRLFVETLDFEPASGEVGLAGARASVSLPDSAARIASAEGISVAYVHLDTRRVRTAEAAEAVRLALEQLEGDLLTVFTKPGRQPSAPDISQLRGRPPHSAPHGDRARPAAQNRRHAAVQHLLALAGDW